MDRVVKFIKKKLSSRKKIIFIVDDDDIYAKSLQVFIYTHFPDVKEVKVFNIGEMCLMELHRNPTIVIIDYILNSVNKDAHNGLEVIKRIKLEKPKTHVIVLSAQKNYHVALEAMNQPDCNYVPKNHEAFGKIEQLIKKIFSQKYFPTLEPWA